MFDDMSTEFVSSKMTVSLQLLLADVRGTEFLVLNVTLCNAFVV